MFSGLAVFVRLQGVVQGLGFLCVRGLGFKV